MNYKLHYKMFSGKLQVEELQQKVSQVEKQSGKKVKQLQDLLRFIICSVCLMLCINRHFVSYFSAQ